MTRVVEQPGAKKRAAKQEPIKTQSSETRSKTAPGRIAVKRDAKAKPAPQPKQEMIIALLNQPDGVTIEDLMEATDWQQHSVRGFLAGTIKKKLGLALTSTKSEDEPRRYRIVTRRGR